MINKLRTSWNALTYEFPQAWCFYHIYVSPFNRTALHHAARDCWRAVREAWREA